MELLPNHATVQGTRCLSEFGARGLTAWARRLDETDEVAPPRSPPPPLPGPSHSLRALCAVALSETSTAPYDLPSPSLPLAGVPFDMTCGSTAAALLPVEASGLCPAAQDVGPLSACSPTSFEEGVYASRAGFGAELIQKGANRLRQTGFRTPSEAALERARWLKSLEQSAVSNSAAIVRAKQATTNRAGAAFAEVTIFTNHSPAPSSLQGKLHSLADLSHKLRYLHGQLEHKKRKLELASRSTMRSTPTWAASSEPKTASPLLVSSLTTSQLLAASRMLSVPAALPIPSTIRPLWQWPSPPLRIANLVLPPPYPAPEPQLKRPAPAPAPSYPSLEPKRACLSRSTSSWPPPGIASRPLTFGESVAQLRTRQTAADTRGYVSALSAASGAAAAACGAATKAGGVAGTCRSVKLGGGAINVTTPSGTLQERFAKHVMCGFTPRRPCELPMSNWVSCDELIGLLQPHAPAEVQDLGTENLKQLITEWYQDHPAYADLPFSAWCKKLTDKTRRSDPRQARRSRSNHFKFSFQCTPWAAHE